MSSLFKSPLRKNGRREIGTVTIDLVQNGFLITEFRREENYKATYVARDLEEVAQVIYRIYTGKTEVIQPIDTGTTEGES